MDAQSAAYREATAAQLQPGTWEELAERGLLVPADDSVPVRLPEVWDAEHWDAAALPPKTRVEAADTAAARGDDPTPYGVDLAQGMHPLLTAAATPPEMYVPWLVDAARFTGYPVLVEPGWADRGHGGLRRLEVVVGHHTATADHVTGDYPSLRIVRDGREGLAGPLSQLGIGRSGAIYVIAAGLAYHAGVSAYAGFSDLNDESVGIEAEDSGDGTWTPAQLDVYPRLVAALLYYMRRPAERYCSHRTCALPAGRKIDPAGIPDDWMRDRVGHLLADPLTRIPRTPEADMFDQGDRNKLDKLLALIGGTWDPSKVPAGGLPGSIAAGVTALMTRDPGGVDEAELAAQLAPLLADRTSALTDTDLQRLATAVADEQARRLAG